MQEDERYRLALTAAETMYNLWELLYQQETLVYQQETLALDGMMRRLKDLSAYSLIHAEILDQREGAELLALAMFFGMTSDPRFHRNQERLILLDPETVDYPGQAQVIEQEVARRKKGAASSRPSPAPQPRLF